MAEIEITLQRHLDSGEAVLWAGRPRAGRLVSQALPVAAVGVPFTAFAVFWIWAASGFGGGRSDPWSLFSLFGVPFVAIGIGLLSAPLRAARRAGRTIYAVTDRRAVVLTGAGTTTLVTVLPAAMAGMVRVERADGSGDLLFPDPLEALLETIPRGRVRVALGFFGVAHVRDVEDLIRAQVLARQSAAPSPFPAR